jgi:asparagine N-glycosylation enzyme membrane subunit Stt3
VSLGSKDRRRAALGLVLLVGLAARLVPWSATFAPSGVRFRTDTDPYYHALRAQRTVADWPRVPWSDAHLSFPYGAEIPWPPLFDFVIGASARAAGATAETPELVARAAALLALLLGVALLPVVSLLAARLLGGGLWLDAALIVAILPAAIRFGAVGAADQHGAELLVSSCIFLAFVSSWSSRGTLLSGTRAAVVCGILVAAAFWTWLGSALYLLILAGAAGLWHIVASRGGGTTSGMTRSLGVAGLVSGGLLAASIALFAPRGALGRGELGGLTLLHVAMCAGVGVFGAVLFAADRTRGPRGSASRIAEATAAAAFALLPILVVPSLRHGAGRGLTALFHDNAWYASIVEYQPLFFSGARPLRMDVDAVSRAFGFTLLAMPLAIIPMIRRWNRSPEDRPSLFFLFFWGASLLALTLTASRFQLYLVVPLALWVSLALRSLGGTAARHWPGRPWLATAVPVLGVLFLASPALPNTWSGSYASQQAGLETDLVPMLRWLRTRDGVDQSRPAVMAEWSLGHAIQYFSGKPVITSPFGTEEGPRRAGQPAALESWAAFLFTSDAQTAEMVLEQRRAGFVLLRSPKNEVINAFGFAPPGTARVADVTYDSISGPIPRLRESFYRLIAVRLHYFDGMSSPGAGEALGTYRLLAESSGVERIGDLPEANLYKLFGVVRGARIEFRGAPHGAIVSARTRIQTNAGRIFEWFSQAASDSEGRATLRLPYATGSNGLVVAGPYTIADGTHRGVLELDEKDVAGAVTDVDLAR